ncbi:GDSL-type esterase/lipase family protein [Candidatus Nitronereus thalassa]|uniref:GDSL-type esterase/lipase family protein n=1 Tax=Candidatus Nitronereus thalassa TaxID=3020898 RepID=A0ABU3KC97_9BACT|nr:GDSL-type esterase/lipase family protein [Candidatus Nitronereus thalassa]MDT7044011.1 GDSL-type esterase/lipase family protein [Candidatus Nitronereus thalassa]
MELYDPYLVCFGDSLTAGYQRNPYVDHQEEDTPYGDFLQKWVATRAQIVVTGICGEVTDDMVKRFSRDVVTRRPQVTVILGGTNDLGLGVSPGRISQNLEQLYQLSIEAGIQPVGVTVPSIRVETGEGDPGGLHKSGSKPSIPPWLKFHIDQRLVLNRQIVEMCRALTIPCLDLFSETVEGSDQLLASRYSSDGLHLNTAGYEAFARLVWRHLLAIPFGDILSEG